MATNKRFRIKQSLVIPTLPLIVLMFLLVLTSTKSTLAQRKAYTSFTVLDSIVFKDTLNGWTTDSFSHNLGLVPPIDRRLVKYFKYIGNETVTISNAWTQDPHHICGHPNDTLVKGKIYSFKVCFMNQSRVGKFKKVMGFDLSNGQRITYEFEGDVQKQDFKEKY
jgi:hypothetical protein